MATSELHKNNHTHAAAFHTTRWSLVLEGGAGRNIPVPTPSVAETRTSIAAFGLKPNMRYELWHSESEGCHTFFPADQPPPDLTADARLIWTVEAATWDEAQTAKHQFLGWEPYQPMDTETDSTETTP